MLDSTSATIVVIEDELEIREFFCLLLRRDGHKVLSADTAEQGLELVGKGAPDLIIVDWMLPGMSGIDFVRNLRAMGLRSSPILMVTAKADSESIVAGLRAGADDYLTKPFEPNVLRVRIQALLRRRQWGVEIQEQEEISLGPLKLDMRGHRLLNSGEEILLTASEFKLLSVLVQNSGKVFSRDDLILKVQGAGINVSGRTIDTHIFTLRKKLGNIGDFIETVRGVGYRLKILGSEV